MAFTHTGASLCPGFWGLRVRETALLSGLLSSSWGPSLLALHVTQVGFVWGAVTHASGSCELLKAAVLPWQVLLAVLICRPEEEGSLLW